MTQIQIIRVVELERKLGYALEVLHIMENSSQKELATPFIAKQKEICDNLKKEIQVITAAPAKKPSLWQRIIKRAR